MADEKKIDPKIKELLDKLGTSRDELEEYIEEITGVSTHVKNLFPKKVDFRSHRYIFEEKMKAVSSLYSTLLSVRQEINKTLTQEIEIRRRIKEGDKDVVIDIRKLIDDIEKIRPQKTNLRLPEIDEEQEIT